MHANIIFPCGAIRQAQRETEKKIFVCTQEVQGSDELAARRVAA